MIFVSFVWFCCLWFLLSMFFCYLLKVNNRPNFTGDPIPRRQLPPEDAVAYYTSAQFRGYLADPEEVSKERLILAQKYGYELPVIEKDESYSMLSLRKDPRQLFLGLEPGWIISLRDKAILKPKDEELREYYKS